MAAATHGKVMRDPDTLAPWLVPPAERRAREAARQAQVLRAPMAAHRAAVELKIRTGEWKAD